MDSSASYAGPLPSNNNPTDIGRYANDTAYFGGTIDEVRISNTARSSSWIATEYNNQSQPGTFYGVGGQQIGPPSVTIDIPTPNQSVSGTIDVGGWAIDNTSTVGTAISNVQVKVDGTVVGNATYGGNRPDVCNAYPGRPGCPYVGFDYWLNTATLSPGPHTITVSATDSDAPPDVGSANVTVNVAPPPVTMTLTSSPPGLSLTADGSACTAPCTVQWTPGSGHTITTTTPQAGGTGTQYVFAGWSDFGAQSHSITATASAPTYTAAFTTQYLLTTSVSPVIPFGAGTISPAGGWHNSGDAFTVSANPTLNSGWIFQGFSGALSGANNQALMMNGPKSVIANFYYPAPVITSSSPLPSGAVGTPYSYALTASGGVPPLQWSVLTGQLPPGLNFYGNGSISGTATNGGTYSNILVRVSDHNNYVNDVSFSITINGGSQLTGTCSASPNPTVGNTVTFSGSASGGSGGYAYSWSGGAVSGTGATASFIPSSAQTYTATLAVRDSQGSTVSSSCGAYVQAGSGAPLPVTASPPSQSVAPGGSAGITVRVNGSAGFSGVVNLTASGLPAGATATFSPPTVSSSGASNLTVVTAAGSSLGTYQMTLTAQNGSQSYNTAVFLTIMAPSPAKMLSPGSGAILAGSTATFVWDSGMGASQYQLALGSSPGASDYYVANTGSAQSTVASIPSSSQPLTVYATLSSLISGAWQSRSYTYAVGVSSTASPAGAQAPAPSVNYVFNNGVAQTWSNYLTCPGGTACGNAGNIISGSLTTSCSGVSARFAGTPSSNPGANPPATTFDVEYTATLSAPTGKWCDLTFNYIGPVGPYPISLSNAVYVYDATPLVNNPGVIQDPPATVGGPFTVQIYGTNFGPSPGTVTVCISGANPCNGTPDLTVCATPGCGGYWSDVQINAVLTPSPNASGTYDIQINSLGEDPTHGFQPLPGQTSSQSNRGVPPIQLLPTSVSLSPATLSLSTGDTNKAVTTTVSPSNTPFSVIYSSTQAPYVQPPGSPCTASLSFSNVNGTGTVSSTVTASSPNCGGIFGVTATVASVQSSNSVTVTVPPQALIRQMVGAAGGFSLSVDPNQVAQKSVGIAAKNRFTLAGFNNWTTWQQFQDAGVIENSNTANGPPVIIDNAVSVYSGAVTSDFVGGAPCYWSPQYQDEFVPIRSQYQSQPNSTTLPSGPGVNLRLPGCYLTPSNPGSNQQIIWKASEPANIRTDVGGVYLNAPAFLFVKQRNPSDPAIVQIP